MDHLTIWWVFSWDMNGIWILMVFELGFFHGNPWTVDVLMSFHAKIDTLHAMGFFSTNLTCSHMLFSRNGWICGDFTSYNRYYC